MGRRRKRKKKSVIKNYGLMWSRDAVFWGRGSKKGVLEGRRSRKVIDFRGQIGVYVLYDEGRLDRQNHRKISRQDEHPT